MERCGRQSAILDVKERKHISLGSAYSTSIAADLQDPVQDRGLGVGVKLDGENAEVVARGDRPGS